MQRTFGALAFSALLVAAAAKPARAQSDAENRATARALGEQGAEALDAKDYAKAEDAFRRADALYHAPTLMLGLARAQAAEGKFVEAWESYNRIVLDNVTSTPAFAKALDDAKREIATVEGRRSRVTVLVTGASTPTVTLDNAPLKSEALGVQFFVDPGTHNVQASAPGFNATTRAFTVAEGQSETVSITLEPAASASTAAPTTQVTTIAPPSAAPAPVSESPHPSSHAPAIVAFAVGGAGLVAGVVGGVLAIRKHSTLSGECPAGNCGTSLQSDVDSYHAVGLVSTVGFIVAGAGAAAGVTLWILESRRPSSPTSGWVAPYVGVGSVGAVGRF